MAGHAATSEDVRTPIFAKLLFWAIVFGPLQRAFTIDLGFPFKISETLIMLAIPAFILDSDNPMVRRRLRIGAESVLLGLLAAIVLISSTWHILAEPPPGPYRGFPRTITVDLALYTFYAMLVLALWAMIARMDRAQVEKALFSSVWICLIASIMQLVFFQAGQTALLEALNFQTEARAVSLTGGGDQVPRSGPFVDGQHLGFFGGAMLALSVIRRKWAAGLAAATCLIYSQSTSGIAGLLVGLLAVLVFQPRVGRVLRSILAALAVGAAVAAVPAGRNILRFQLGKIGIGDGGVLTAGGDVNRSLDIRSVKSEIGFDMMLDNPSLGVGSGRYGVFFFDYPRDGVPDYYFKQDHRAITENVYAHIGSELGLLALVLFSAFVLVTISRFIALKSNLLAVAVFVAVGIVTQSSWTFIPIWIFFGYLTCAWVEGRDEPATAPEESQSYRTPLPRNGLWPSEL